MTCMSKYVDNICIYAYTEAGATVCMAKAPPTAPAADDRLVPAMCS